MDERIERIIKHPACVPVAVGVVAFGSGLAAGFFIGRRKSTNEVYVPVSYVPNEAEAAKAAYLERNRDKVETAIDDHIGRMISPLAQAKLNEDVTVSKEIIKDVKQLLNDEDLEVTSVNVITTETETITSEHVEPEHNNIFANDDEWNYEEELAKRSSTEPYVLHKDEFYADESKFPQHTLTYYEGDDTLADEDNNVIYNKHMVIGDALKFGHGSGEQNVVYIRNERLRAEYEVFKESGLYAMEVLGLSMDEEGAKIGNHLRHSGVRKFKQEE